jgi:endothelin-converting enzyme
VVPAGLFQDPFFSNDRPQYMNYGAIGSLINVNDDVMKLGKWYDKHGNNVQWWTNVTNNNYSKKMRCIIIQHYYIYMDSEIIDKVRVLQYVS